MEVLDLELLTIGVSVSAWCPIDRSVLLVLGLTAAYEAGAVSV